MKSDRTTAAQYRAKYASGARKGGKAAGTSETSPVQPPNGGAPLLRVIDLTLTAEIPLRVVSAMNVREHWAAKARRVRTERHTVTMALTFRREAREVLKSMQPPYEVTLTRIGPKPFDGDNAQAGLKGCRDAVADVLGVNDGDESACRWVYGPQEIAAHYGVRIEIREVRP